MTEFYHNHSIPFYINYATAPTQVAVFNDESAMLTMTPDYSYETIFIPLFYRAFYDAPTEQFRFYWSNVNGESGAFTVALEFLLSTPWPLSVLKTYFPELFKLKDHLITYKLCLALQEVKSRATKSMELAKGGLIKTNTIITNNIYEPISGYYASLDHASELNRLSNLMPAAQEIVEYPCNCPNTITSDPRLQFPVTNRLMNCVMHLNDMHTEWTREKIADWIDELHEAGTINAEFELWNDSSETDAEEKYPVAPNVPLDDWITVGYTSIEEFTAGLKADSDTLKFLIGDVEPTNINELGDSNDHQD
jgi:hypothetical protein